VAGSQILTPCLGHAEYATGGRHYSNIERCRWQSLPRALQSVGGRARWRMGLRAARLSV